MLYYNHRRPYGAVLIPFYRSMIFIRLKGMERLIQQVCFNPFLQVNDFYSAFCKSLCCKELQGNFRKRSSQKELFFRIVKNSSVARRLNLCGARNYVFSQTHAFFGQKSRLGRFAKTVKKPHCSSHTAIISQNYKFVIIFQRF